MTIPEVAEEVGFSKTTYHDIRTENFGMHRVAAVYVPRLPSDDRKQNHVDISKESVDHAYADEYFLKNSVTGDETWVYSYDVEPKAQSSQWVSETSPRRKKHTSSVQRESDCYSIF